MAFLVNNGAGTTFSTAANWDTVTNTPALHATTNVSIGSSSYYGATFTAPNTTNYATGVLVYVASNTSTAGTVTAHLEENSAGWVTKASSSAITATTFKQYTFYYFRFTTPYLFAATTANYYRIRFTGSGRSGTLNFASATTSTSVPAFIATDDRHTAPTIATDDIFIVGANGTPATITVDGTGNGVGTGATTTLVTESIYYTNDQSLESRRLTNAIHIGQDGKLDWDNTASSTLTVKGNIYIYNGGTWEMDGSGDQTILLKLVMDLTGCTTATGGYGIGKGRRGYCSLQGAPKSSTSLWKTTVASGVGTAADPLITTDAVDWIVGDKILFPTSSDRATNVTESENRYIITKNSASSYVLSATAGGVESGITAAYHTYTTYALNITRNVVITTSNSATPTLVGLYLVMHDIELATIDWDWCKFENTGSAPTAGSGSAVSGKDGLTMGYYSDAVFNAKYVVVENPLVRALNMSGPCISGYDTVGWIVCNQPANCYGVGAINSLNGKLQTHTDFWLVNLYNGPWLSGSQSCVMTRCFAIGTNQYDGFNRGGFVDYNSINCTYQNCEAHANNRAGFTSWGLTLNKYIDCAAGTKGRNRKGATATEYQVIANGSGTATGFSYFHNALFDRLLSPDALPTDTFGYGPYMLAGSEMKFNDYNGTVGDNWWFTRFGYARATTTNARSASSKCIEISPLDSTDGFTYDFLILARANTAVQALGFVKKHSVAVGSVATVKLFLPGSTTADFTQTMPDDANWNPFVVYANYTGSVDLFARVEINIKATSGLFLVDDIFNGTNNITALDASFEAKPSPVMFEQLGDAAAIWAVPTATLTTTGTTGKKLVDDLTTGKFIALK